MALSKHIYCMIKYKYNVKLGEFLYKYFKKYIPDTFYVSSTIRVDKTEEKDFGYNITHKLLTLNNLSVADTADLFDALNTVLKIGTAENLVLLIR